MTNMSAPKLQKSRIRHSRYFIFLLLPLIIFDLGYTSAEGFIHETAEWLGYFLIILCVFGRSYCSLFIGGRKNDLIIQDGPYSVVRNPLYVFSFFGLLGIGLQSGIYSLLLILVISFCLYYRSVVAKEEAFLEHKFGDAFRAYKAEVPRWIPRMSLWKEAEFVEAKPSFIRKTALDASFFFLAYPVFELLEELHRDGIIPTFFHIY